MTQLSVWRFAAMVVTETVAVQLLAEVSIPELAQEAAQKRAGVEMAAADVTQAERGVDVMQASVAAAKAGVDEAKAGTARARADAERWDSELKRFESMAGKNVVDAQSVEEARRQSRSATAATFEVAARVASAEQMVLEATAKLARARADVLAVQARKKVAEADAARVMALLDYTHIRAPYAGYVTARLVHTGHFLQPGMGGRAEPIFVVARSGSVRVFAEVPEVAAAHSGNGAKVTVRVPSLANREYEGTIARTSRVLSAESRTLRVEVDLPNADAALRPGMYAMLRVRAATPDAFTLPASAILFADETAYIYVVEDGKANRLRVRVGRSEGTTYEILGTKRGPADWQPLAGTEAIVAGSLGALADGQPVERK